MKRRSFLRNTSAISIPFLLNGSALSAMPWSPAFSFIDGDSDKVLILVQLNGGNDGLNMIIPLDQYQNLYNARANIMIPENEVLKMTDTTGMHPSMTALKDMYDDGLIATLQSVGYPDQNRSHFRSTDIWTSGSPADETWTTGWLGRYFQGGSPDYPIGYPNADCPHPFALTLSNTVSQTCQGEIANFSMALKNPFNISGLPEGLETIIPDTHYGQQLLYMRTIIEQTNDYGRVITEAANKGANLADYPVANKLAEQLKTVALLISGGLQTKVFVVNLGGFDTHAGQVSIDDPTGGEHSDLLRILSEAVHAFQSDIIQMGIEERVIGMTFSEFGRQIKSNGGLGTDHGTAAPLLVFGSCVNPQIFGDNPDIPAQVNNNAGVPMQFDFRSVYGSILMDWFGATEDQAKEILYDDFQYIPFLSCSVATSTETVIKGENLNSYCYPNPFVNQTQIVVDSVGEHLHISVLDSIGRSVRILASRHFPEGTHRIMFEGHQLPAGNYFYRIQSARGVATKSMVKQ